MSDRAPTPISGPQPWPSSRQPSSRQPSSRQPSSQRGSSSKASWPALGVTRVSLNFAVFRSALERGERLGAGPFLRGWRRVLLFASRWFQIESLYRFNAKFQPAWEPRFVVYPATRDLPRIAVAALESEAFLTWPHLRTERGVTWALW